MIEFIRQWLIGVTCAALIAALADGLMAKGAVKQVGKFVCSLVLLCAVLRPFAKLDLPSVTGTLDAAAGQMDEQRVQLERQSEGILKRLIEQECAAYIVDKAQQVGFVCQAQVTCAVGEDGTWLPQSARIVGQPNEHQQNALSAALQEELGISVDCQVYVGGE